MVPTTALAIPTYLLFSKVGMVNTAVGDHPAIAGEPVRPLPDAHLRAGRGPGQPHRGRAASTGPASSAIFFRLALRLLAPGIVTVLLFTLVATWNNYFLPLIMLNDPNLYPVTVGLASWSSQAVGGGGANAELLALVVTGSMLSIVPLVAAFLLLQRYWQSGLSAGGVKE